jgi:hypothetical protein
LHFYSPPGGFSAGRTGVTISANDLNISQVDLEKLFKDEELAFKLNFTFNTVNSSAPNSYITEADRDAVKNHLENAIRPALEKVTRKYSDGVYVPGEDVRSSLGSTRIAFNTPAAAGFIVLTGTETYMDHNREVVFGCLNDFANPSKISGEKGAWEQAAIKK